MRRDLSDWYDQATPSSRHSVSGHGGMNPADRRQMPHPRPSPQSNQGTVRTSPRFEAIPS
jgi:hypothetical protein